MAVSTDIESNTESSTSKAVELTTRIKAEAHRLGFSSVGIAAAERFDEARQSAQDRIADGHMAGMAWFTADRADVAADPHNLLPTARSIISVALPYDALTSPQIETDSRPRGRVARYAWGRDYHDVLKERMAALVRFIEAESPPSGAARSYRTLVDTARIFDRAVAQRAGVGWFGKNTNIITGQAGSWVLLGEILTELELTPDPPVRKHCGSCTRCLTACPTGAIIAPYTIDANRCISYLTIEHRGSIPRELRPMMGNWVFGCDICQDVCPPNFRAASTGDPALSVASRVAHSPDDRATSTLPDGKTEDHPGFPDLIELLGLTDAEFRARFRGTAIFRAKRVGLARNAAVALGNSGSSAAVPALITALCSDASPLVRGHAAWALGRIGTTEARNALASAKRQETDPMVREEIDYALDEQR